MAKCEPIAVRPQIQERQITSRQDKLIEHRDDNHFLINLYALHNATLLRKALPNELTKPTSLYRDRKSHHIAIASTLRVTQEAKRAKTQEKRKATLAAKQVQKRKRAEDVSLAGFINEVVSEEEVQEGITQPAPKRHKT